MEEAALEAALAVVIILEGAEVEQQAIVASEEMDHLLLAEAEMPDLEALVGL